MHAITICFYAYKCYATHTIPSYLIFALRFSPCIISLYNMISMRIMKLVMDSPMPTSSYMENLVCPYTNSTSSFLLFPLHYFYIIILTLSSSLFPIQHLKYLCVDVNDFSVPFYQTLLTMNNPSLKFPFFTIFSISSSFFLGIHFIQSI